MPSLRTVSFDFLENPPEAFRNSRDLACSADEAFALLADISSWSRWFPGFKRAEWLSPAPHGVDSRRQVEAGGAKLIEHLIAFEPGKRFAFYMETIDLPIVKAMGEDWRLTAIDASHCRISHVAAYEPNLLMKLIHPVARIIFGGTFRKALDGLQAYVAKNAK